MTFLFVEENNNEESEAEDVESADDNEDIIVPSTSKDTNKQKKQGKKGIIYISSIPKHMNVSICRELLESYGEIDRIFLQPDQKGSKSKFENAHSFAIY